MKIAIALSGGIDSAVAAYLLKEGGHQVWGITMLHHVGMEASLPQVRKVAEALGISLEVIDLKKVFYREVILPFAQEYTLGRTPNPCPLCNRRIKMGILMERTLAMGAQKMATGHYARIVEEKGNCHLMKGKDKRKDQSYFLALLYQGQLSRLTLPLGNWSRPKVENLAQKLGLSEEGLHSSQEICFLKGHYTHLLKDLGLDPGPGPIRDIHGNILGNHKGYIYYTIGQRRGLGVAQGVPLYVVKIIPQENTVVVGPKEALFSKKITILSPHWIHKPLGKSPWLLNIKIRYRHREAPALVEERGDKIRATFDTPQRAPTPGQLAVLYRGDEVLGGGWIEEVCGSF